MCDFLLVQVVFWSFFKALPSSRKPSLITCVKFWSPDLPLGILKTFFGAPSFLYFLHSPVLWVVWAPLCILQRSQCFLYRVSFGTHSSLGEPFFHFLPDFFLDLEAFLLTGGFIGPCLSWHFSITSRTTRRLQKFSGMLQRVKSY